MLSFATIEHVRALVAATRIPPAAQNSGGDATTRTTPKGPRGWDIAHTDTEDDYYDRQAELDRERAEAESVLSRPDRYDVQ